MAALSLALIAFGAAAMLCGFGVMIRAAKQSREEWEEQHDHKKDGNKTADA